MSATHPDLAAQACGWDPNDIVAGSHRNLEWICQLGHTWLATPKNRSRQNQGCPYCSGQRVLAGFNDLATVEPDLAREMVGDASTITRGSNKKVTWRCDLGHEWDESPKKRKEGGCPYCSSHRVWPGFNDLATTHPQLAEQLVEVDPTTITAGSNRPCAWRCVRDHVWVVPPYNRMIGMGCPFCSGKRVLAGFNDLATTHPEIAATAEGWDVTALTAGSNKKVGWRCEKGHDFSMAVANRALRFQGCPVCLGKKVLPGVNDLATLRPEIAAQAHGWDPSTVVIYANKRREWRCHRGHTWTQTVAMRTTGNSCPYCANQLVWVGFNDLATTHPEIAAEADGWDPSSVTAGTDRSLLWSCPKGLLRTRHDAQRARGRGGQDVPPAPNMASTPPSRPGSTSSSTDHGVFSRSASPMFPISG